MLRVRSTGRPAQSGSYLSTPAGWRASGSRKAWPAVGAHAKPSPAALASGSSGERASAGRGRRDGQRPDMIRRQQAGACGKGNTSHRTLQSSFRAHGRGGAARCAATSAECVEARIKGDLKRRSLVADQLRSGVSRGRLLMSGPSSWASGFDPCLNRQPRRRASSAALGRSWCRRRITSDGQCWPRIGANRRVVHSGASSCNCPTGHACPTRKVAVNTQPMQCCSIANCARSSRHRLNASTNTPAPTIRMPIHSRTDGRSPRKATANTVTSSTLSLSTGATLDASPIFSARK